MDDPKKQPDFSAMFKAPMDSTKTPPQLRRPTLEEASWLVDGTARQQSFFAIAEVVGKLMWGTWAKINARTQSTLVALVVGLGIAILLLVAVSGYVSIYGWFARLFH